MRSKSDKDLQNLECKASEGEDIVYKVYQLQAYIQESSYYSFIGDPDNGFGSFSICRDYTLFELYKD